MKYIPNPESKTVEAICFNGENQQEIIDLVTKAGGEVGSIPMLASCESTFCLKTKTAPIEITVDSYVVVGSTGRIEVMTEANFKKSFIPEEKKTSGNTAKACGPTLADDKREKFYRKEEELHMFLHDIGQVVKLSTKLPDNLRKSVKSEIFDKLKKEINNGIDELQNLANDL